MLPSLRMKSEEQEDKNMKTFSLHVMTPGTYVTASEIVWCVESPNHCSFVTIFRQIAQARPLHLHRKEILYLELSLGVGNMGNYPRCCGQWGTRHAHM